MRQEIMSEIKQDFMRNHGVDDEKLITHHIVEGKKKLTELESLIKYVS